MTLGRHAAVPPTAPLWRALPGRPDPAPLRGGDSGAPASPADQPTTRTRAHPPRGNLRRPGDRATRPSEPAQPATGGHPALAHCASAAPRPTPAVRSWGVGRKTHGGSSAHNGGFTSRNAFSPHITPRSPAPDHPAWPRWPSLYALERSGAESEAAWSCVSLRKSRLLIESHVCRGPSCTLSINIADVTYSAVVHSLVFCSGWLFTRIAPTIIPNSFFTARVQQLTT
mmetsp:Transcript_111156/g.254876  ORF Transcript_111156/g.254876 Transcript_111156/m.254876 type:complete len:227 (+) Transcript_111156:18-698(+)